MNEQIKKIMEETGLYIAYENKSVTEKELEFFAQSIVRECVECLNERAKLFGDVTTTVGTVAKTLKQHFGINNV